MEGKLIIFSAPSGAGKSTIVRHLLSCGLPLEFSISATSRLPRGTEKNGIEYYFLTPQEFRKKIDDNEFLEWEEVYPGQYYGTLKNEAERIWKKGKHIIFDIDVMGGINLKEKYPERSLSVFVSPPSPEILEKRLRARNTDTEEALMKRIGKAGKEMLYAGKFDVILINDVLEETLEKAEKLVREFLKK